MKAIIEKAINADITQQNAIDKAHGKAVATLFGLCAHIADKSDIKDYCDGWQEAMKKTGRPESSVKVEKSNRKLILEFATGNKKDCDIPRDEAVNLINSFTPTNNSIDTLAKAIREYLKGETEETDEKYDFAAELAKLIEKAEKNGIDAETIRKVVINTIIPDQD